MSVHVPGIEGMVNIACTRLQPGLQEDRNALMST